MAKVAVTKFVKEDVLSQLFSSFETWEVEDANPCESVFYGVTLKKDIGDFEKGDYIPAVLVSFSCGYFEFLISDEDTEEGEEERVRFSMKFGKISVEETEIDDDEESSEEDDSDEDDDESSDEDDDDEDESSDEDEDADEYEDEDDEDEAPKKRRGRPAKSAKRGRSSQEEDDEDEAPKKRGRPSRKKAKVEEDDDDDWE